MANVYYALETQLTNAISTIRKYLSTKQCKNAHQITSFRTNNNQLFNIVHNKKQKRTTKRICNYHAAAVGNKRKDR